MVGFAALAEGGAVGGLGWLGFVFWMVVGDKGYGIGGLIGGFWE